MEDEMKPLKHNDEVYIKSLNMLGKVCECAPGDVRGREEKVAAVSELLEGLKH